MAENSKNVLHGTKLTGLWPKKHFWVSRVKSCRFGTELPNCLMECVFEQNCFCQGKTWRPKCWGKYPILGCCGCFGLLLVVLSAIQVQSGHNIAWNSFSIYSFIKSWNLFPWKNRNKKLKSTYIWISEIYERKHLCNPTWLHQRCAQTHGCPRCLHPPCGWISKLLN